MLIASRFRCLVGKRRKAAPGSAAFQPCSTSGHGVQRPAGYSISIHERDRRAGGSLGCRKTDRPQAGGSSVLLYAVFATHPQRGEYSRPPLAPAVIAPQHRCLAVTSSISLISALRRKFVHFAVPALPNGSMIRWEPFYGWRVPQGSPASLWEDVSKFHYPPRCRRLPQAGQRFALIARSAPCSPPWSSHPGGAPFAAIHTGFVPGILYFQLSVGRLVPPHLSGGF